MKRNLSLSIITIFSVCFFITLASNTANAGLPAFPGAEGGGANAIGGRGGRIIEVTNLNDSGPGSFRAACEASGPRIIIFRVAGRIHLKKQIVITEPYITIAGQTAPGGGIILSGLDLRIKTHDVIIRYLRHRQGRNDSWGMQQGHCIALSDGAYNVIVDHCSFSWSNDENVAIWSYEKPAHDITFSWNIIAEGLEYKHDSCNLIVGSNVNPFGMKNISIHHNLFMSSNSRSPLLKCASGEVINNLIYNWGNTALRFQGGIKIDILANYFKHGPNTSYSGGWEVFYVPSAVGKLEWGISGQPSVFIDQNKGPHLTDPSADNWRLIKEYDTYKQRGQLSKIISKKEERQINNTFPVTIDPVYTIEGKILENAGACRRLDQKGNWILNRDAVDQRLINEYMHGKGQIPLDEKSVGGYPNIENGIAIKDSDHDGLPDQWETENNLNPFDPADAKQDSDNNGYPDLEDYLNGSFQSDVNSELSKPTNLKVESVIIP